MQHPCFLLFSIPNIEIWAHTKHIYSENSKAPHFFFWEIFQHGEVIITVYFQHYHIELLDIMLVEADVFVGYEIFSQVSWSC